MHKLFFSVYFVLSITILFGQPASEIFLFDVNVKHGNLVLTNPKNISNHKGYDNQPFFHPDLPFLYYSSADDEGRTDIIQYNYKTNQSSSITKTAEREYSPKITPDGNSISCIVQRDNGAQDLVEYPLSGEGAKILIDNLIVGYHAWGDKNKVFVFTLPAPFKLHFLDLEKKTDTVLAENIGRSLHTILNGKSISYTQKVNDLEWRIMKLNVENLSSETMIEHIAGKEPDMCWTPEFGILRTDEKKILLFDEKRRQWKEVQIKSKGPLNSFTRLAMSPDGQKLAVVVSEEK